MPKTRCLGTDKQVYVQFFYSYYDTAVCICITNDPILYFMTKCNDVELVGLMCFVTEIVRFLLGFGM